MFCSFLFVFFGLSNVYGFVPLHNQKCYSTPLALRAAARILYDVGNQNNTNPEKRKYSISFIDKNN